MGRSVTVRTGKQARLVFHGVDAGGAVYRDPALIKLVARAHQARGAAARSSAATLNEGAAEQGLPATISLGCSG